MVIIMFDEDEVLEFTDWAARNEVRYTWRNFRACWNRQDKEAQIEFDIRDHKKWLNFILDQ